MVIQMFSNYLKGASISEPTLETALVWPGL